MENSRKEILILSMAIVFVIAILASSSYAWYTVTDESKKDVTIRVGDLNLTYTDNNHDVELLDAYPMSVADAFDEDGYTFTLTNNGSMTSDYTVILNDKALNDGETKLDDRYVRYILKSGNATKIGLLSELTDNKLVEGVLLKNGSVTFNLRLFLDEDEFDKDAASKVLKKEIKVTALQDNENVNTNQILTTMTITTIPNTKSTALDIIKLGDEEFYNIGEENGYTKLLAKSCIMSSNLFSFGGNIENFSSNVYWEKLSSDSIKYDIYVYDSNSKLYPIVEEYVSKLNAYGVKNISGRLLSLDEAQKLSSQIILPEGASDYWLGTAVGNFSSSFIYAVNNSGKIFKNSYYEMSSVRPVILIPSNYLK